MCRIDDQHVDAGIHQCLRALHGVTRRADGCSAAKPSEVVLARIRILDRLLNVLDGDQSLQPIVLVHHQQLFDLVAVQDLA